MVSHLVIFLLLIVAVLAFALYATGGMRTRIGGAAEAGPTGLMDYVVPI